MPYVPQDLFVFTAAMSGALAGMAVSGRVNTDAVPASYDNTVKMAGAFAQEVDTLWVTLGPTPTTEADVELLAGACQGLWEGRLPVFDASAIAPATYDIPCRALIAICKSSHNYFTANAIPELGIAGLGIYGDGSDGVAACDGVTIVTGLTLVGTTYTANRDVFFTDLTVSAGATLITNGFRICVNRVFHVHSGFIHNNGKNAVTNAGGTALPVGTLGLSFAGGAGSIGIGVGVAGTNGTQGISAAHGTGGAGGAGGANAGGAASTVTALTAIQGTLRALPAAWIGATIGSAPPYNSVRGGAGGGGGGSNGAAKDGGGGGGGGGVMMIAALTLHISGTGTISVNGGTGANASAGAGDAGGGGGGGGGTMIMITRNSSGVSGASIFADGGLGGTGGNAGVDGDPGVSGNVIQLTA
jgi:hypothetical protein